MTSPSLYQVISAAGLAPEALQVRLCGVWALRRTTGPPSTIGSEGGTVKQSKHTTQNKKSHYSSGPERSHIEVVLILSLLLLLAQHQYIAAAKEANNIFLRPCVCLTRCSFRLEEIARTVVIWKKTHTQPYLFPSLGLALLLYLLLLLQSDVSTELLICSFICMVSHAPLASQACHP